MNEIETIGDLKKLLDKWPDDTLIGVCPFPGITHHINRISSVTYTTKDERVLLRLEEENIFPEEVDFTQNK